MNRLISAIRSIFSNELDIELSRDVVTVRWDGQAKVIRPIAHVTSDSDRPRVVGVDELFGTTVPTRAIPLFGELPPGVTASVWLECLDVFIRYAFANARAHMVVTKPLIRLRGVGNLGNLPGGAAGDVLIHAFLRAGALACKVED